MPGRWPRWAQAVAGLLLVVLFLRFALGLGTVERLPDFSTYATTAEKKAAFFEYLRPRVETALAEVKAERARLVAIEEKWSQRGKLSRGDAKWLRQRAAAYGLELDPKVAVAMTDLTAIKTRMDVVPVSLVLAQASLESAWGSSRFAREGNNLFGMRCYTRGCGLVPRRRAAGATFEVTRFDSLAECFAAYVHNLNTHEAYGELRRLRAKSRREGTALSGYRLAPGLVRYSEEGWDYVGKIQSFIRSNRLDATP